MLSLKYLIASLIGFLPLALSAQATHVLGYCDDDLTGADMIGVDGEARISAAIHLPKTKMQRYKDGRIIRIRVAFREGITKPSVWIRTSLTESSKVTQSISQPAYGWNEVSLNTPLTIDGNDLYIGYTFTQPSGVRGILAKGGGNTDTSLLAIDNEWSDYHSQGVGILFIQAIVEYDMPGHDLAVTNLITDSLYYRTSGILQASATMECIGALPISGYTLTWNIDGGDVFADGQTYGALSPEETRTVSHTFSLAGMDEGEHYAEVAIMSVDEDEKAANDTLRIPFYVYTSTFSHQVLLEHFTSMPCVNCPPVDHLLESVVDTRDDVVWVSHHVGYHTDEFTIEASEPYTRFGVLGNPYIMLDRYLLTGETPAFTISNFTSDDLQLAFDMTEARPAFVTLNASLQADGQQLTAEVNGTGKAFFQKVFPRATLNVYIVEDDVLAQGSQAGDANKKRHNNITRAILTRQSGNLPSWIDATTFSDTFTTEANESWDISKLRVVAFVTAAADRNTGYPSGEVLNTVQAAINAPNHIMQHHTSIREGIHYYTIDGRRLANHPLSSGIYLIDQGDGFLKKTLIK